MIILDVSYRRQHWFNSQRSQTVFEQFWPRHNVRWNWADARRRYIWRWQSFSSDNWIHFRGDEEKRTFKMKKKNIVIPMTVSWLRKHVLVMVTTVKIASLLGRLNLITQIIYFSRMSCLDNNFFDLFSYDCTKSCSHCFNFSDKIAQIVLFKRTFNCQSLFQGLPFFFISIICEKKWRQIYAAFLFLSPFKFDLKFSWRWLSPGKLQQSAVWHNN